MSAVIENTGTGVPASQADTSPAAVVHRDSVPFLVFELAGQRYGVDVAEVEGLFQAGDSLAFTEKENVLVYEGQKVQVKPLARWVGLRPEQEAASGPGNGSDSPGGGAPPVPGAAPSRLLLSRRGGKLNGLLVDMPRDIVSLPLDTIFALPPLIRQLLADSPLWGVGRAEDGLILLVDPASRHRSASGPTGRRPGSDSSGEQEGTPEEEL